MSYSILPFSAYRRSVLASSSSVRIGSTLVRKLLPICDSTLNYYKVDFTKWFINKLKLFFNFIKVQKHGTTFYYNQLLLYNIDVFLFYFNA